MVSSNASASRDAPTAMSFISIVVVTPDRRLADLGSLLAGLYPPDCLRKPSRAMV